MKGSSKPNADAALSRKRKLANTWKKIMSRFPTDKECLEELYAYLNDGKGPCCPHCGSCDIVRSRGARSGKCSSCFETVWITAGTVLEGIKAARAWLGAIKLLEKKVVFNISELAWLAGTAYSSAWSLMQKIMFVVSNLVAAERLAVDVPLPCFESIIHKRSKLTPSGLEPFSEQTFKECRTSGDTPQNFDGSASKDEFRELAAELCSEADNLTGFSKELFAVLDKKPVHIDTLLSQFRVPVGQLSAALTLLQLEGLVDENPDSFFAWSVRYRNAIKFENSAAPDTLGQSEGAVATHAAEQDGQSTSEFMMNCANAAIEFVKLQFGGVSRKYLQLFLSTLWCYAGKKRKAAESLPTVFFRSKPVRTDDIRFFVSPQVIKVMPAI